jgi:hypothetical protein
MTPTSSASPQLGENVFVLRIYLILVVIGGLITIFSLQQFPTETKNIVILGLSWARVLMISGILIVILLTAVFLFSSWFQKPLFIRFEKNLSLKTQNKTFYGLTILICSLVLFGSAYLILLTPEITEPFTQAYFVRLQPLIAWVAALSVQTLVVLPLLRYGFDLQSIKPKTRTAYIISSIFAFLLLILILINQTRLGLTRTDAGAGWNALGTPLLEMQAFAAWIIALLF